MWNEKLTKLFAVCAVVVVTFVVLAVVVFVVPVAVGVCVATVSLLFTLSKAL